MMIGDDIDVDIDVDNDVDNDDDNNDDEDDSVAGDNDNRTNVSDNTRSRKSQTIR